MTIKWENRLELHPRGLKRCSICKVIFPYNKDNFHIHHVSKKTGEHVLESYCRRCSSERRARLVKKKKTDISSYARRLIPAKRYFSSQNNVPFDLDAAFLVILWNTQNGLCYYTGQRLDLQAVTKSGKHPHTDFPSLDRKDPAKGYTKENVVWSTFGVNRMKNDFTADQFLEFCRIVAKKFS